MKYLLDSDILFSMLRGQHGIQEKIYRIGLEKCRVSEISLAELYVGAYKRNDRKAFGQAEFTRENFELVPVSGTIRTYAELRAALERAGRKLDSMDLLIAAAALEHRLTLVTNTVKHFSRIPGLAVENWIQTV